VFHELLELTARPVTKSEMCQRTSMGGGLSRRRLGISWSRCCGRPEGLRRGPRGIEGCSAHVGRPRTRIRRSKEICRRAGPIQSYR
jgi:hypothetical protein